MGIEAIAEAVVAGNALVARNLTQDWIAAGPLVAEEPPPGSSAPLVRAVAAALTELFAERLGQTPPAWAASVGPVDEPYFLVTAARTMTRFRRLCEEQSPLPLRRRRLFAPPGFLTFA